MILIKTHAEIRMIRRLKRLTCCWHQWVYPGSKQRNFILESRNIMIICQEKQNVCFKIWTWKIIKLKDSETLSREVWQLLFCWFCRSLKEIFYFKWRMCGIVLSSQCLTCSKISLDKFSQAKLLSNQDRNLPFLFIYFYKKTLNLNNWTSLSIYILRFTICGYFAMRRGSLMSQIHSAGSDHPVSLAMLTSFSWQRGQVIGTAKSFVH